MPAIDWNFGQSLPRALETALILSAAIFAGLLASTVAVKLADRFARLARGRSGDSAARYVGRPLRLLFPLLALNFVSPSLALPPLAARIYEHALGLLLIAAGTYLFINIIALSRGALIAHFARDRQDELRTRKLVTQVQVLEKIAVVVTLMLAAAFMLMTFDSIRQVGVSILASAGVAGVIVGFAAQRSIGALLAGVQIALTQPIRLDDVVIVEGEFGTVEEISLTYVVIKAWDLRRLVFPITYFIEKPFQNLTRTSTNLLGTVTFVVDYTVPVEPIRQELRRLVEASGLWDGRSCNLQVTSADAKGIELRCLLSAENADKLWDLRCFVREKLVALIADRFPFAFAKVRGEIEADGAAPVEGWRKSPPRRPTANASET